MPSRETHVSDRRVARTQKALREALHSLVREKDYDDIAVKEILDRANVGRSAFYSHFRDKDDLLASTIHDIIGPVHLAERESVGSQSERLLWFSLPVFEHHDEHRWTAALKMGPRERAILHEHLWKVLVGLIGQRAKKSRREWRGESGTIPTALLVEYLASTFILVLDWWFESRSSLSADQVNHLFCSLVQPTLTAKGL